VQELIPQQASIPSPEGAYKTEKTEIDTARKGGHVEAGT